MTYDDIVAVFFTDPVEPIPLPTLPDTPARRLRDALEPIATHGWWARRPAEAVAALGLGFFDGYVWGRAAALGTPTAAVVVATFGVFEPTLLSAVYAQGAATASRDAVLAARAAGAESSLAEFVEPEDAAAIADPLLRVLSDLDGLGRPLFSALRALPMPTTAAGRLWRASELVREHRGDGHLAAVAAAGLDAATVNVLTECWLGYDFGTYSTTRGFSPAQLEAAREGLVDRGWMAGTTLTDAGRRARLDLEAVTDVSQQSLVAGLGAELDEVVERAEAVSSRLVAGRAFPPDPRKRAAG